MTAGPYEGMTDEGMTDEAVLAKAHAAFEKATALPVGSVQRAIQWGVFDSTMAELDRRLVRHVVAQLREEEP